MRSLSNLIKSRYVYVNDENKKIIDSNGKSEVLKTIQFNRQFEAVPQKDEHFTDTNSEKDNDVFTEGLNVTVIDDAVSEDEMNQIRLQAAQIITDANEQAAKILTNAEEEAKSSSQAVLEEARQKGYEEGLQKAMSEVNQLKTELEQLKQKHNKDYLDQLAKLEPMFADIVAELVEKITGVIVKDKKEVILYLIHNSMTEADNSKSYTIRVSKDEYELVLSKKEELNDLVPKDAVIDIILDKNLSENQCLIETDTRMIDCSLDVQLTNLIQDIKLISKQKE